MLLAGIIMVKIGRAHVFPVDGVVLEGSSAVNEATLTGEAGEPIATSVSMLGDK